SGVGFLGAGVILRRDDDTVSGLTTAAIVWGAAGIGVATGAGFYAEAITGVVLLLVSIEVIPVLIKRLTIKKLHLTEHTVQITQSVLLFGNIQISPLTNKRLKKKKIQRKEKNLTNKQKNEVDPKEIVELIKKKFIKVKDIQIKDLNNDEHFLSALIIVDDSVE